MFRSRMFLGRMFAGHLFGTIEERTNQPSGIWLKVPVQVTVWVRQ